VNLGKFRESLLIGTRYEQVQLCIFCVFLDAKL
jgi:hypothetical protein